MLIKILFYAVKSWYTSLYWEKFSQCFKASVCIVGNACGGVKWRNCGFMMLLFIAFSSVHQFNMKLLNTTCNNKHCLMKYSYIYISLEGELIVQKLFAQEKLFCSKLLEKVLNALLSYRKRFSGASARYWKRFLGAPARYWKRFLGAPARYWKRFLGAPARNWKTLISRPGML